VREREGGGRGREGERGRGGRKGGERMDGRRGGSGEEGVCLVRKVGTGQRHHSPPCRLYDLPNSELMKHWDKTYTFLKEAK
jgi:hypothetical protein